MRYQAYLLNISSDLPLPELALASDSAPPDVHIRCGQIAADARAAARQLGPYLWAARDALWLDVPQVASFEVRDGNSIVVDVAPGSDPESVRLFLLGSAIGALLQQRGLLVLHGNAVRVGHSCMVCVGHSGAGKSTLAAGFMQRGHQILADDVVPVDAAGRALPGFPRIKLWQDVARKLDIDTTGLVRIRPGLEKFNYPLAARFGSEPLPIRWVYVLHAAPQHDIELEVIRGLNRFRPLGENTYRAGFLDGLELRAEHLAHCGRLAGSIHLAMVRRPAEEFRLDALIDRLLADMELHP
ncbi:MAG: hypothetical protein JNJ60_02335 [Rhodocyclaceae bacterium]|nr:hypothetical protein [Rhodocyclaceae bacterium]